MDKLAPPRQSTGAASSSNLVELYGGFEAPRVILVRAGFLFPLQTGDQGNDRSPFRVYLPTIHHGTSRDAIRDIEVGTQRPAERTPPERPVRLSRMRAMTARKHRTPIAPRLRR